MWAGAASSSLTGLGHIEVIFPGFTQHCVRREGYPVDPIALCEGGSASMNVAFERREASRHADSLYLLYLGNRLDATSNSHNDVIMVSSSPSPPVSLSLCISLSLSLPVLRTCCSWVTRKESPAIFCAPSSYLRWEVLTSDCLHIPLNGLKLFVIIPSRTEKQRSWVCLLFSNRKYHFFLLFYWAD